MNAATNEPPCSVRRAGAKDLDAIVRLMGDEAVFGAVLQMPYPNPELWRTRLAENDAPAGRRLLLVAEAQGEVVGQAGLHACDGQRRQHAMGLGICVAAPWHGRGIGRALMAALLDYADRWAGVLRIELTVYADNDRAVALYRRFGFEEEGRLRAFALRGGRYADVLAMARLHPDPPRLA